MAFRGATTAAPAETGEQHQANFVALFTSLSDSQPGKSVRDAPARMSLQRATQASQM